jgi:hypothetical protein
MLEASERREMRLALDRQRNAYKPDNTDERGGDLTRAWPDNTATVFNPYVELDDGQIVESSLKQVLVSGDVRYSCRPTVVFSKGTLSTVWWNPSGGERLPVAARVGPPGRLTPPTAPQTPGPPRTGMRITPRTTRPTFARW